MSEETKSIRLQMVIAPSQVATIDAWRKEQDDLPSRSEAIRRLIDFGLLLSVSSGELQEQGSLAANFAKIAERALEEFKPETEDYMDDPKARRLVEAVGGLIKHHRELGRAAGSLARKQAITVAIEKAERSDSESEGSHQE